MSEANRFLETEYRELFNQRFAVEPEAESIFVSAAKDLNLDSILCVKHTRKTDAAGTFSFKNRCFQILDEGIRVEYGGRIYNTIRYLKPQNKNANTEVPQKVSKTVEPHLQLRHSSDEWKAIWWMEDYNLSLKFLYELFFEKQQSAS